MRPFLTILLFLTFTTSFGQKYSKTIKDTSIVNFMSWLFQSDTVIKVRRHVDNDILKWHINNVAYPDSSTLANYQFGENIFLKNSGLTHFLNKQDANFFAAQIKSQRKQKWQLKLKEIELYDTVELVNNRLDTVLFSYSLPLFSADRRYVVIIEAFYCGVVCGGGAYNLYERQGTNTWKKIKTFNEWAE